MKSLIKIFALASVLFLIISCSSSTENIIQDYPGFTTGVIVRGGVEGPLFGILTREGLNLDPINLPVEYQILGKEIIFKYTVRNDLTSTHMWGTIVEINEVK